MASFYLCPNDHHQTRVSYPANRYQRPVTSWSSKLHDAFRVDILAHSYRQSFLQAMNTFDGTSLCLCRWATTCCTILSAKWGDKQTIMSSPLVAPISHLNGDDCPTTNCATIMTTKVKMSPQRRRDPIPNTIKTLIQPKSRYAIQEAWYSSKEWVISRAGFNQLTWASNGVSGQLVWTYFCRKEKRSRSSPTVFSHFLL